MARLGDLPRTIKSEAQRLAEDARLLHWNEELNSAQGVAPPPQFVWEKTMRLGHRHKQRAPEMRSLVAPGPQRRGEKMAATLSKTLEPVPRPFACQGCPPDGDDASEGPFWVCQKNSTVAPPLAPFWGP